MGKRVGDHPFIFQHPHSPCYSGKGRPPCNHFRGKCSDPHAAICSRMGTRLFPFSVKEYSTLGGISGYSSRWIRSSLSRAFNCWLKILSDIVGNRFFNCPYRCIFSEWISQSITHCHFPPTIETVYDIGQTRGSIGPSFMRSLSFS